MDVSNLINGASSGASVGSQFGHTGTVIGAVAGGALGALSGSRDKKAYERSKELLSLNNQMQRQMVEDSSQLQKTGLKKAGISVASLNGGFSPANSPQANLPAFSTDAQIQSANTQSASALASLLQSNPVAEAQKNMLDSQADFYKAQVPKVKAEKQSIENANQYFIDSRDKMLATLDADLQQKLASKELTQAQKDSEVEKLNKLKAEINQITFNIQNTAELTASQIARNRQEISESLSRVALNKALRSEADSRAYLNKLNAKFVKLGIGGNDCLSTYLRVASTSPELFDTLKKNFVEMANKVNPLAVGLVGDLFDGIKEIGNYLQKKTNKFFDGIYNGHYEMVNGKMEWIQK